MLYFDPLYLVFALPGLILSVLASLYVKTTFSRFSRVHAVSGLTGAQAAYQMLQSQGITNVRIEHASGFLGDHYDPTSRTLRLSDDVYGRSTIAAIGVACHEAGHAVQHAVGYAPIKLRTAIIPITNIGSKLAMPLILLGLLFMNTQLYYLVYAGILCFSFSALFQLVTLPTEFNASRRALSAIESGNLLYDNELAGAKKTLRAAALTYVAALAVSLAQLLRLFLIVAGRGRRND